MNIERHSSYVNFNQRGEFDGATRSRFNDAMHFWKTQAGEFDAPQQEDSRRSVSESVRSVFNPPPEPSPLSEGKISEISEHITERSSSSSEDEKREVYSDGESDYMEDVSSEEARSPNRERSGFGAGLRYLGAKARDKATLLTFGQAKNVIDAVETSEQLNASRTRRAMRKVANKSLKPEQRRLVDQHLREAKAAKERGEESKATEASMAAAEALFNNEMESRTRKTRFPEASEAENAGPVGKFFLSRREKRHGQFEETGDKILNFAKITKQKAKKEMANSLVKDLADLKQDEIFSEKAFQIYDRLLNECQNPFIKRDAEGKLKAAKQLVEEAAGAAEKKKKSAEAEAKYELSNAMDAISNEVARVDPSLYQKIMEFSVKLY